MSLDGNSMISNASHLSALSNKSKENGLYSFNVKDNPRTNQLHDKVDLNTYKREASINSWNENDVKLAVEAIQIFESSLSKNFSQDLSTIELKGQDRLDYVTSSFLKSKNVESHKDLSPRLLDTHSSLKIENLAKETYQLSNEYISKKRESAFDELSVTLNKMIADTETEGEAHWKEEIEKVIRDWDVNHGPLRKAYDEAKRMEWNQEEIIVSTYVNDQVKKHIFKT
jgi:hypothetical protein